MAERGARLAHRVESLEIPVLALVYQRADRSARRGRSKTNIRKNSRGKPARARLNSLPREFSGKLFWNDRREPRA